MAKKGTTMKTILLAGLIGICATGAFAHSPLKSTTPVNKAVVTEVPAEIGLDFTGKIRLTRVKMHYADQPSVDLDLSENDGFISEYAIPLQGMGTGIYQIDWRGLGTDGHALNGSFSFTVE